VGFAEISSILKFQLISGYKRTRVFKVFHRYLAICCFAVVFVSAGLAQQAVPTLQQRLGYPADARLLIIHSDDLGMSHSVNKATFEALEKGWITSSSILVPCPWFPEVANWARTHPEADLGIHLALNSEWEQFRWGPVAPSDKVASLLEPSGYFPLDPENFKNPKPEELTTELHAQIEKARAAGIRISHLDSHMAALFGSPTLSKVYQNLGHEYSLPILVEAAGTFAPQQRSLTPEPEHTITQVLSITPGVPEREWLNWYKNALAPLKPGVYELIVHLAYDDDEMRAATFHHPDWGAAWRQSDLDTVSNPEFQQFLKDQHFVLVKWRDLSKVFR
jgi:chitin disaccharide deacetylase